MDYTTIGFAGLCLLVSLACVIVAAHRGGTMKLNLPFVSFDGDGLMLTPVVRAMFVLLGLVALACAVVWTFSFGLAHPPPRTSAEPTATATATTVVTTTALPDDTDGGNADESGPTEPSEPGDSADGSERAEPDPAPSPRLVEVWSGCDLQLGHGTTVSLDGDDCPVVTGESGELWVMGAGAAAAQLEAGPDSYIVPWEDSDAPTGEQCRREVEQGGQRAGRAYVDDTPDGHGVCIRTSTGDRYVYLRFETAVFPANAPWELVVEGSATAWELTSP